MPKRERLSQGFITCYQKYILCYYLADCACSIKKAWRQQQHFFFHLQQGNDSIVSGENLRDNEVNIGLLNTCRNFMVIVCSHWIWNDLVIGRQCFGGFFGEREAAPANSFCFNDMQTSFLWEDLQFFLDELITYLYYSKFNRLFSSFLTLIPHLSHPR